MPTNLSPSDSVLRDAVCHGMADVSVPDFDFAAIRNRRAAPPTRHMFPRRLALVASLAAILIALVGTMPSVIAQVERVLHAFTLVNGQLVPLEARTVTLDEARAVMPFNVVAPAGIPSGLHETITAIGSASSPNGASLIFHYSARQGLPLLTIAEYSAAIKGATSVIFTERRTAGIPDAAKRALSAPDLPSGTLPPHIGAASQRASIMRNVEIQRINGRTLRRAVTMHPIVWVTRGTRIVLAAPDGTLTPRQTSAIRAAMSE